MRNKTKVPATEYVNKVDAERWHATFVRRSGRAVSLAEFCWLFGLEVRTPKNWQASLQASLRSRCNK